MKKSASDTLHELLEMIRQKPQIYIGEKSLIKLSHFLNGAGCALYLTYDDDSGDFLKGFQEWIQLKYGITSTQHWSTIIHFFSFTDAQAFDLFFKNLDEFNSLDLHERSYETLLQKNEAMLKAKHKYNQRLNEIMNSENS